MIQFLGFLKNPIFKFAAEKTMGAINHKLQKDKIIKDFIEEGDINLDLISYIEKYLKVISMQKCIFVSN